MKFNIVVQAIWLHYKGWCKKRAHIFISNYVIPKTIFFFKSAKKFFLRIRIKYCIVHFPSSNTPEDM